MTQAAEMKAPLSGESPLPEEERELPRECAPQQAPFPGEAQKEADSPEEEAKQSPVSRKEEAKQPPASRKEAPEKRKVLRALGRLLLKMGILAGIVAALLTWVGSVAVSHDTNMFPAVCDGNLAITYKLGGYYTGDLVVYTHGGATRFGRVAAVAGDVIDIGESGSYTVNGVVPASSLNQLTYRAADSQVVFPYTVQEGEVFLLNDYRENAYDSRVLGGIREIRGKVVLLLRRRGF